MYRYTVEFANFSGGWFKTFFFKYYANKYYEDFKGIAFRVTLKKYNKKIKTQVNEQFRPKETSRLTVEF